MKAETPQAIIERAEMLIIRQKAHPDKPINLSKADKFALAFVAGVNMKYENVREIPADCLYRDTYTYKVTTKPCNVVWDGKRFCVFVGV